MSDLLIVVVASLVFGGAWWGLSRLGASAFVVAAGSFFLAMLVFVSRTLFGVPL